MLLLSYCLARFRIRRLHSKRCRQSERCERNQDWLCFTYGDNCRFIWLKEAKLSNNKRVRPVMTDNGVEYVPTITQKTLDATIALVPGTVEITKKGWDATKNVVSKFVTHFKNDDEQTVEA